MDTRNAEKTQRKQKSRKKGVCRHFEEEMSKKLDLRNVEKAQWKQKS
jgi:hypothetical protein